MAKRYLLPCKECEAKILIETTQAGQTIQCRSCKAPVTLGTLRDIQALQPDVAASSSSGHVRTGPKMSVGSRLMFVIGTLLLAAGSFWGGTSYMEYRDVLPNEPETAKTFDAINKVTNRISAKQLFDEWNKMDITAFDNWKESDYQNKLKLADAKMKYSFIGFGIAAAGLLAILGAFIFKL